MAAAVRLAGGDLQWVWAGTAAAADATFADADASYRSTHQCQAWCTEQFASSHCVEEACFGCSFCSGDDATRECTYECATKCLDECVARGHASGCVGVAVRRQAPGQCVLFGSPTNTDECERDKDWMSYIWPGPPSPPSTPLPPTAPPLPPSEPPTPPTPAHPPLSFVEGLNLRFMSGRPSNDLMAAGVLVRQMDVMSLQSVGASLWGVANFGDARDRIVGSVINRLRPYMYSTSAIGFILSPEILPAAAIRCSYPNDGGSLQVPLDPRSRPVSFPLMTAAPSQPPTCHIHAHQHQHAHVQSAECVQRQRRVLHAYKAVITDSSRPVAQRT